MLKCVASPRFFTKQPIKIFLTVNHELEFNVQYGSRSKLQGTEGRTGLIPASSTSGFSTGELAFVGTIRSTAALKNFRRFVFLMHSPACITDEICRSV